MSAENELRALLVADAGVTALVAAAAIAQNAVPQGTAVPYIVYTSQRVPEFGLANNVLATGVTFRIECWGNTPSQADAVADAVVEALLGDGVVCTVRATGYDGDLNLDATVLTAEWWE